MTIVRLSLSLLHRALLVAAVALGGLCAPVARGAPENGDQTASDAQAAAERELEHARSAVAEARAAAMAIKAELDAIVAESQRDPRPDETESATAADSRVTQRATSASSDRAPRKGSVESQVAGATQADIALLERLIADLQAERKQLLTHLTTAHPLIVDADVRIEEYQQQLAALTGGGASGTARRPAEAADTVAIPDEGDPDSQPGPQIGKLPPGEPATIDQASLQLEEAFARWEAAQESLLTAMDAESAAAERLAALAAQWTPPEPDIPTSSPASASVQTKTSDTAAAGSTTEPRRHSASQPLILAALIIAVVIAALASVKLARASDETVFAGADDAASTLALPVVGVFPAVSQAWAHGSVFERYRTLTFVGQMLLAVVVFALVAYCVQNPGAIWQLCTDPLQVLGPSGS